MPIHKIFPTIIKWSVGLILGICLFTVIFEYEMSSINVVQLTSTIYEELMNSCDFFALESYRDGELAGTTYDLLDQNGAIAISGKFYEGTEDLSYRNLYCDDNACANEYVDWLEEAFDSKGYDITENFSFQLFKSVVKGYATEGVKADHITPSNFGLTYLDKDTLEHIFKWKLVNELTCQGNDIDMRSGNYGKRTRILNDYAVWRGFRIYYDTIDIKIDRDHMELYDLCDPDDAQDFYDLTGIEATGTEGQGLGDYLGINAISSADKSNMKRYVVMYNVKVSMDVGYEGILPVLATRNLMYNMVSNAYMLNGVNEVKVEERMNTNQRPAHTIFDRVRNDSDRKFNEEVSRGTFTNENENFEEIYKYGVLKDDELGTEDNYGKTLGLNERVNFYIIH